MSGLSDLLGCFASCIRRRRSSDQKSLTHSTIVFGAPLSSSLPAPVTSMLCKMLYDGPSQDGVFRLSAAKKAVDSARREIDSGARCGVVDLSVNIVGSLLKEWLRNIPGGVLSNKMLKTAKIRDSDQQIAALQKLLSKLPATRQLVLGNLMSVLCTLAESAASTRMDASNLAVCIAPNLASTTSLKAAADCLAVTTVMISRAVDLFDTAGCVAKLAAYRQSLNPAVVDDVSTSRATFANEVDSSAPVADTLPLKVDSSLPVADTLPLKVDSSAPVADTLPLKVDIGEASPVQPAGEEHIVVPQVGDAAEYQSTEHQLAATVLDQSPVLLTTPSVAPSVARPSPPALVMARPRRTLLLPPTVGDADSPFTRSRVPLCRSRLAAKRTTVVSLVRLFESHVQLPGTSRRTTAALDIEVSWSVRDRASLFGGSCGSSR